MGCRAPERGQSGLGVEHVEGDGPCEAQVGKGQAEAAQTERAEGRLVAGSATCFRKATWDKGSGESTVVAVGKPRVTDFFWRGRRSYCAGPGRAAGTSTSRGRFLN